MQAAACPAAEDAMAVDAATGQAALMELSAYMSSCSAVDPNVRAILAKFGPALGVTGIPWAGAIPPPFPPAAARGTTAEPQATTRPEVNQVAAALAASLKKTEAPSTGAGSKGGGPRALSGSRSPTPGAHKDGGGNGPAGMGPQGAAPNGGGTRDGLAQLQATLGLTGAGQPVPDDDDV